MASTDQRLSRLRVPPDEEIPDEVKALFAMGVPARWDAESMSHAVEYCGHQARTLFKGVFQVPPGHYLIATDHHFQLNQYWDFDYPAAGEVRQLPAEEYAADVRQALEEAVKLRPFLDQAIRRVKS